MQENAHARTGMGKKPRACRRGLRPREVAPIASPERRERKRTLPKNSTKIRRRFRLENLLRIFVAPIFGISDFYGPVFSCPHDGSARCSKHGRTHSHGTDPDQVPSIPPCRRMDSSKSAPACAACGPSGRNTEGPSYPATRHGQRRRNRNRFSGLSSPPAASARTWHRSSYTGPRSQMAAISSMSSLPTKRSYFRMPYTSWNPRPQPQQHGSPQSSTTGYRPIRHVLRRNDASVSAHNRPRRPVALRYRVCGRTIGREEGGQPCKSFSFHCHHARVCMKAKQQASGNNMIHPLPLITDARTKTARAGQP